MAGLNSIARKMRKLDKEIPIKANKIKQQAAIAALKSAARNTPVDTSRAVSNWLVNLGGTVSFIIPTRYVGKHGSTRSQSMNAAINEGTKIIAGSKPGEVIHVGNNIYYIDILEGRNNMTTHAEQAANQAIQHAKIKF